jgi:hypothetical protein
MKKQLAILRFGVWGLIFCTIISCKKDAIVEEKTVVEPYTVFISVNNLSKYTYDDIEIDMGKNEKQNYGIVRYGVKTEYKPFKFAVVKPTFKFTQGDFSRSQIFSDIEKQEKLMPGKYTCEVRYIDLGDNSSWKFETKIIKDEVQ